MVKEKIPNVKDGVCKSCVLINHKGIKPSKKNIIDLCITRFTKTKAHIPKMRPSNFFCFAIISLFIMNSYLSLKRKNEIPDRISK
jgi:hypothetical protein